VSTLPRVNECSSSRAAEKSCSARMRIGGTDAPWIGYRREVGSGLVVRIRVATRTFVLPSRRRSGPEERPSECCGEADATEKEVEEERAAFRLHHGAIQKYRHSRSTQWP
jgi:hypothetical protein